VPRKKLPMRKITEVLRLRAAGMTNRDLAASTGVGKTTIYEYLARAEAAMRSSAVSSGDTYQRPSRWSPHGSSTRRPSKPTRASAARRT